MKIWIITTILCCLIGGKNDKTFETKASWYGDRFHGRPVACFKGEKFDMNTFTAAGSSRFKCGDIVKVTNITNNKTTQVVINDRGAFEKYGRDIDLSKKAFSTIADLKKGVITVKIEIIEDEYKEIN